MIWLVEGKTEGGRDTGKEKARVFEGNEGSATRHVETRPTRAPLREAKGNKAQRRKSRTTRNARFARDATAPLNPTRLPILR